MTTEKPIPLHILEEITNGFSADSIIGRGGYGDVYKGVYNGREIAVKLLHVDTVRGLDDQQFKNEVGNLLRVKHPNIVQLIGYCYETKKIYVEHNGANDFSERIYRVLCFEYMQRGSLDAHLCGQSFAPNWNTRYNIIKGVCEGLNFFHKCEPQILHLDLKPANILLDGYMEPKVADLGLSRLFTQSHTHVTERIVGSRKYMPPEFVNEGKISPKNDVFSFGVVMIEIITSSLGYSSSLEMGDVAQFKQEVLASWSTAIEATSKYRSEEIDQVTTCIELAIRCVDSERDTRPTAADILDALNKTEANIPKRRCCPQVSVPRLKMAKKRKKTRGHLKGTANECAFFPSMQENVPGLHEVSDDRETSAKIGAQVIGREKEKQEIMARLSGSTTQKITFFQIYGIGGIGKTTMAQSVFNDSQFKEYSRVWIYVSQTFDLKKIGNSIITQLSGRKSKHTDLQMIENSLQKLLSCKRVLIILDDLWERKSPQLEYLESMLKLGEGGKVVVVVTTREESTALKNPTDIVKPYKLPPLTDAICWTIIKNKSSFESRVEREQLELIGKEIAKKCGGVALAAQSIGYMLDNMEFDEWVSVNNSEIWDALASGESAPHNVHASLLLSYQSMDKYLKLCFAYCATFPKGREIAKEDLAHQWIALGLVEPSRTFSDIQTSHKYIRLLFGMCFLEHPRSHWTKDGNKRFVIMHDLVHDLARSVLADKNNIESPACQYAWLTDIRKLFKSSMNQLAKIRALHILDRGNLQLHGQAFSQTKCLCVLDLSRCSTQELPDSIGQLEQLRYLDASWNPVLGFFEIQAVPEAILIPKALGSLNKLQYLNLSRRRRPIGLPEVISKLMELRYLNISHCDGYYLSDRPSANQSFVDYIGTLPYLEQLDMSYNGYVFCVPESFSRLRKLNLYGCFHISSLPENVAKLDTLRLFGLLDHPLGKNEFQVRVVDSKSSSNLVWLKHTNPDVLGIVNLENVKSVEEARSIRLMEKQRIEELSLVWSRGVRSVEQKDLLTELVPPRSVKNFKIMGYADVILPHWFMCISKHVSNLVSLEMWVLPFSSIPALVQLPNLRKVVLRCTEECNTNVGVDAAKELKFGKIEYLQIECSQKSSIIPSPARAKYLHISSFGACASSTPGSFSSSVVCKLKIEHPELPLYQWRLLRYLPEVSDLTIAQDHCNDLTISPQITRAFTSLQSLSLDSLRLEKLPDWLGELTSLRQLNLERCYRLQEFHESMRQLKQLQSLSLRYCEKLTSLPQWLGELTLLKKLKITDCRGIISLPESILTNLQELRISDCPQLYKWHQLEENQMKLAHIKEKVFPRSTKASGQWSSSVVADLGHGPPNSSQNNEGLELNLAMNEKNMSSSFGWPDQLFLSSSASASGSMVDNKDDDVHPNLYGVMNMPGFTAEALRVALSHLVKNKAQGHAYLGMDEENRLSWLRNFSKKHVLPSSRFACCRFV